MDQFLENSEQYSNCQSISKVQVGVESSRPIMCDISAIRTWTDAEMQSWMLSEEGAQSESVLVPDLLSLPIRRPTRTQSKAWSGNGPSLGRDDEPGTGMQNIWSKMDDQ